MNTRRPDTSVARKIRYFEKEAPVYDEKRSQKMKFLWGKEVEIVASLCGDIKGKRVLEVGVGTGRFSMELAKQGANVTALDPTNAMLTVAKEKAAINGVINRVSLVRASGNNLPFRDSSFDVVICMHVLKHLPTYKEVLKEIARVTNSSGFIIVNSPNSWSFYLPTAIYSSMRHVLGKNIYSGLFTKWGLRKVLEDTGFTIEKVKGFIFLHPKFFPEMMQNLLAKIENYTSDSFLKNFSGFFIIKARRR